MSKYIKTGLWLVYVERYSVSSHRVYWLERKTFPELEEMLEDDFDNPDFVIKNMVKLD